MKYFFSALFLLCTMTALGQISFPKGFKLIETDNVSGEDDQYSNGKDVFRMHTFFRSYEGDFTWNDDKYKQYIAEGFGFPFYRTTDSLLWGTGKNRGFYSYVVATWDGEVIELFSKDNDADFSQYSKWLISSVREYRKRGKKFMFPARYKYIYGSQK